jgi:hypothetical protein
VGEGGPDFLDGTYQEQTSSPDTRSFLYTHSGW